MIIVQLSLFILQYNTQKLRDQNIMFFFDNPYTLVLDFIII